MDTAHQHLAQTKKHPLPNHWRFAVDRGGTFTDVVGVDPQGCWHCCKLLSRSPLYPDATIAGIAQLLGHPPDQPLPAHRIAWIRLGTTVATNALLERKGAPTGLLITQGFRDLLAIGDQRRPQLFALTVQKAKPLYQAVAEVEERLDHNGQVLVPLNPLSVEEGLAHLRQQGCRSVVILFLHAWLNPRHEALAAQLARQQGFDHVYPSHDSMPLINATQRGQTTLVDGYLTPVLLDYRKSLQPFLGEIPVYFMSSNGGLLQEEQFTGKDAVLSGPAGGVLGVAAMARLSGDSQVIGFDMGGTSTDVCRVAQTLEHHLTATTAGITFQADRLRVETVAAGGGSILDFDGQKLTVGPASAGADPGPACYGLGGPATVTDANVVLGRLAAQHLPKTFGPDRNQPLDEQASHRVLTALQQKMAAAGVAVSSLEELAMGFVTIADETMAAPIRTLSISRGFDPRQHSLLSFGGAGGQHACGVARHLEMACIRIPPLAGLLSAVGMGLAARTIQKMRSLLLPLSPDTLQQAWQVAGQMAQEIHPTAPFAVQVELRTPGTDACLPLPLGKDYQEMVQGFATTHQNHYGFAPVEQGVEMVHLRVTVTLEEDSFPTIGSVLPSQEEVSPMGRQGVFFLGRDGCLVQQQTPVYEWSQLPGGWSHAGAALIVGPWSTVVVEPDFVVGVENTGLLTLTPQQQGVVMPAREERDPVLLELFNHRFMAIATNMGETLARTAHSVNIKERLDFSCAIFDAEGRLIANAPHIPVHLGAMGACVTDLYQQKGALLRPGDVYISNDPVAGGSHLPDVTAISPVFRGNKVAFFVASRGHHADMGGITPGSMPPFAKTLQEEGVVLRNVPLVQGGVFLGEAVTALLAVPPYPARNLPERLSDLRAQAAANQQGVNDLITLCQRHGDRVVAAYMDYMRQAARQAMEAVLNQMLGEKSEWYGHFEDSLDGGEKVACQITLRRDEEGRPHATIDFVGTAPQQENNLNAPSAVVRSAVLYGLRTLISRPIPLNHGCLEPVTLIIPEGCLLKPAPQAAVAAGNVETSQRLVDVLLGALGVAAASQGTMNNFLFGRPDGLGVPYYETIAGGAGATAEGDGASGVQVHMTNTRITDPEILETRLPHVRLEAFHLALSTGGEGCHKGGDGVVRTLRFLQPMTVSLLTQRRTLAPFGLAGGQAGQRGENRLLHADGREEILPGHCQVQVAAGDAIRIQTPGGGGFGDK